MATPTEKLAGKQRQGTIVIRADAGHVDVSFGGPLTTAEWILGLEMAKKTLLEMSIQKGQTAIRARKVS